MHNLKTIQGTLNEECTEIGGVGMFVSHVLVKQIILGLYNCDYNQTLYSSIFLTAFLILKCNTVN